MSFADVETGLASARSLSTPSHSQSSEDAEFARLQSALSLQVFKINANVQGISKLLDQLGTGRDSAALRKSLHDLTETTRAMAKRGSDDLKELAKLGAKLPHRKTPLQKTSHDFQLSLVAFQRAQQLSAERQRTVVEGVRVLADEELGGPSEPYHDHDHAQQQQQQLLQSTLSPAELAYQESLIEERQAEIQEIETSIHELAEIFKDLGTVVGEQGAMIDNIESNISSIAVDTSGAAEELTTAHAYQRKAGRRALCLMLVIVVVVAVVLLAVLS
ncbi:t-SNARE [Gloeophyllum trabeum ATCC 11539]|uniref:t-SNARE n=1 Tax=Gloeophyllum trabeum (strain ATCC 11539 / FP-39264 / Madison 617) TaxID=670483 RepID=S7RPJ4_GLOTA|nr:t-SNARE [Gloeophyllum trabeum ATCC 11539]EPQ54784.1 t-SNARE [Gloeophyllum trabeum ATCC 11539]